MWEDESRQYIKDNEGLRLKKYRCSRGKWTIGYGHKILLHEAERMEGGITLAMAELLFEEDWAKAHDDAYRVIPYFDELSDTRKIAFVDMAYQMGRMGLVGFRKMLKAVNRGDWLTAAAEVLDSKYARQDSPSRAIRNAQKILGG